MGSCIWQTSCRETKFDFSKVVTPRLVLSLLSRVFDPIVLVAPFTVTARLLRKIWFLDSCNAEVTIESFIKSIWPNCAGCAFYCISAAPEQRCLAPSYGQIWVDVLQREMIERLSSWSSALQNMDCWQFLGAIFLVRSSTWSYTSSVTVTKVFNAVAFLCALVTSSNNGKGTELAVVIGKARAARRYSREQKSINGIT